MLKGYYEMTIITKYTKEIFLQEEIRDKMIHNLNYTINCLNGPKARETLKVKDMKDLGFDPKLYLTCIIRVYLGYINDKEFLQTIVNDERSFSIEILQKTEKLIKKYNMLTFDEMQ